ncbi:uncharacterized protein LOC122655334 [Telopea speciosissima]|uniref:uncharacterized protein LOC122655334 n=1 Tax=Telopea speciosissima TaxID=54955 RepID=UPI001CC4D9F1|nr:uncharacterized protein LOC122655334 [Telopea speciosissima]
MDRASATVSGPHIRSSSMRRRLRLYPNGFVEWGAKRHPAMTALSCSTCSSSTPTATTSALCCHKAQRGMLGRTLRRPIFCSPPLTPTSLFLHRPFSLRVTNDSNRTEVSPDTTIEISEADKIVDGMSFSELCNDFECISSPSIEATARQLARDILELREGNRALGTFSIFVKYKDPIRTFTGREKYKRPLWVTGALDKPSVQPSSTKTLIQKQSVQEMVMLSTSLLRIKWTIKGKPKFYPASIGGDLIVRVTSQFTLNQISGQVIEHEEFWDLSSSSAFSQAFFWMSRRLFAATEAGKDTAEVVKELTKLFSKEKENLEIYPDPSGDPTKFFQRDDSFRRDTYQIALFLAVVYFVVQFLRTTL